MHVADTRPRRRSRWRRQTVHGVVDVTAIDDKLVAVPSVHRIQPFESVVFSSSPLCRQRITSQRWCMAVVGRQPMTAVVRSHLGLNILRTNVQQCSSSIQLACWTCASPAVNTDFNNNNANNNNTVFNLLACLPCTPYNNKVQIPNSSS